MYSVLKKKKKGCSGKDLQKKKVLEKCGMKERVGDEKLIIISVILHIYLQRTDVICFLVLRQISS